VLAIGSAISLGPVELIFVVFPFLGLDPHHNFAYELIVPFYVIFILTLAYVLVVQRAMALRILIRMGAKYTLARGMVWVLRAGVVSLIILLFSTPTHQVLSTIARIAGIALLIGLLRFGAFRHVSDWVDRKFFREAYNTELVLTELSEHARRFTEKQPLIETITRRISDVLHVPQVAVWLRGSDVFHLQQALGIPMFEPVLLADGSATVQTVSRADHPVTLYRENPDEWFVEASAEEQGILNRVNTEVLLGLPGRDRLMGVIALGPKQSEEPYTPSDLRLLRSVATQTGMALEVSDLAHSLALEAAQRERIHREMEIAREVQERLFPQYIPATSGVDLAGHCRPAQSVGGDYYDFIELEAGRLGLAIGDVSGKGISAALLMASLRASLRGMTLYGSSDLAGLMQKVNRLVYEASAANRYATFFFAVYDPTSRELSYVNAGHNPPVLLHGAEVLCLETGGCVVGLMPSVPYSQGSLTLAPGDILLAYTDGISEAMTASDEEWGEERMIAAFQSAHLKSAGETVNEMFRAADTFTRGAPQHDDMTVVVLKLSVDSFQPST
jgi:sigma-B regulation protein RsbU (phosphoserine phosphatase)